MYHEIWKFPLKVYDEFEIEAPDPIFPLSIQVQGEAICLWAIVNPDAPKVKKKIFCFGTGHTLSIKNKTHIGTVQQGRMVWHFFIGHNY